MKITDYKRETANEKRMDEQKPDGRTAMAFTPALTGRTQLQQRRESQEQLFELRVQESDKNEHF